MFNNNFATLGRALIALCMVTVGASGGLKADDTEIYQAVYTPGESGSRPNVLIIFDNSGSMDDEPGKDEEPPEGIQSKLEVAQEVVQKLIADNETIDFGLALFNTNRRTTDNSDSGGRIVKRVFESERENEADRDAETDAYREDLIKTVGGITTDLYTPLCETTYETYRYFAGKPVYYGHNTHAGDMNYDQAAENSGTYISPATDCANTYIILMTDGLPTRDTDANKLIKELTEKPADYVCDTSSGEENCLPEIAEYMATTDLDGNPDNGKQIGITYTIGFDTEQDLLEKTAAAGAGDYYTAADADGLAKAFQGAITSILETESSFSSPSAAVNSFNRTQSRDDVFFSMFEPKETIDWPGNIKKLKINTTAVPARLEDMKKEAAIDSFTGAILGGAYTYWNDGAGPDGGDVEAGGVGALLAALDADGLDKRQLKTNSGAGGVLEDFTSGNLDAKAYGFDVSDPNDPTGALFDLFDVDNQQQLDAVIQWGRGYDVDSDLTVTGTTRSWILADMLHSQPLIVNYGATGSDNEEDGADLRIVVGTNGGFLHMFNNKEGDENWAFFPKRLGSVLTRRARNGLSGTHVYGVDASPVLYTEDVNHDGHIKVSDNDKAWVFVGLRRGGRALYALDISDPDQPLFKWKVTGDKDDADYNADFEELGYTWSNPVVAKIPGYYEAGSFPRKYKPVLIFGAGYDPRKDAHGVPVVSDNMGRGIFVVDADTGALIWSVTPGTDSATNLKEDGLLDSVPAVVRTLDSNGDELTDRIYFGDTGGNLWRVDMPGSLLPRDASDEKDTWRIVKMADMNDGSVAGDRRFFNGPDVVRTRYGDIVFDAVLIGSGDRTNPNGIDVDNQFYMIRDRQVNPFFTAFDKAADCDNDPDTLDDFRCDMPLVPGDLYDVIANDSLTAIEQEEALFNDPAIHGWALDLQQAPGEKSLSSSLSITGRTYFGTFSPNLKADNQCIPSPGTGRFYVINLLDASADFDFDKNTSTTERSWIIGDLIPDTPSVHIDEDGVIRLLLPPGSGGGGAMSNPFLTGATLPDPYGEYWYREEY